MNKAWPQLKIAINVDLFNENETSIEILQVCRWLKYQLGPFVSWVEIQGGLLDLGSLSEIDAYILKEDPTLTLPESVREVGVGVRNLIDLQQKESFLIQLYTMGAFSRTFKAISALQDFHQSHKLQFMAFSPSQYKVLGQIASNSANHPIDDVFHRYRQQLLSILKMKLTPKKYVNVFQHMLGYFKKDLGRESKGELLQLLDDFAKGRISLPSLSDRFSELAKKYSVPYLLKQSILNPYPREIL